MTQEPEYNPDFLKKRWVGYFDLLGTKKLIKSKSILDVFLTYAEAITEASKELERMPNISSAWFSDTFLLFSTGTEKSDFVEIDHVARWFVYFLIDSAIPVRGSIAYGDLYVDVENSLYFGSALVEAYEYGEAQDWIGFLICPSAEKQMEVIGIPANKRLNYAYWKIPYKEKLSNSLVANLPACILGQWISFNTENSNPSLLKLTNMKELIPYKNKCIRKKYENAIKFIEKKKRIFKAISK